MYQYKGLEDTIAAIATPPGVGGIGIIRLSGKQAIELADCFVRLKSDKKLADCAGYTVHYGWAMQTIEGRVPITENTTGTCPAIIDEVLVTLMRGLKSYTAEDVVEISCHGGIAALQAVLSAALAAGARLAEPGEFTKRAFLNGRIDLTQAEAVLDVIRAKTETFLRVSNNQLKGELSIELEAMRQELMSLYVTIEALINFPEDDIDAEGRQQIFDRINAQAQRVERLLKSADNGRLLKEGIRIVLCGKPNVGKSSLLNALLKTQRAIVTNIAGTTRDVLEESAQINGIPFQLVDTAGLLTPRDLVEEEAVKRSLLYIDSADVVLLVLDASQAIEDQDQLLIEKLKGRPVIVVLNKSDLPLQVSAAALPFARYVYVSALSKKGIDQLEKTIVQSVWHEAQENSHHGVLISNMRHVSALKQALTDLSGALGLMDDHASWEFISEQIKAAINQVDAITGRNIDEDLLDRIFSDFCIGK